MPRYTTESYIDEHFNSGTMEQIEGWQRQVNAIVKRRRAAVASNRKAIDQQFEVLLKPVENLLEQPVNVT